MCLWLGLLICAATVIYKSGNHAFAEDISNPTLNLPANNLAFGHANSWLDFSLEQDGQSIGKVGTHLEGLNLYIRLESILGALNITFTRADTFKSVEIQQKNGHVVTIDLKNREIIKNQDHTSLYDNDLLVLDDRIFVSIDLLHRILDDWGFVADLAARKIRVTARGCNAQKDGCAGLAPAPMAAPQAPVIIDNAPEKQPSLARDEAERNKPDAEDVLHSEQTTPDKSDNNPSKLISKGGSEEETVILQPIIKGLTIDNQFMEAISRGEKTYLPLKDFFQAFDFPLTINQSNNSATGYFFEPSNTFDLDVEKKEVTISGKSKSLTDNEFFVRQEIIYVEKSALASWFDLKVFLDLTSLNIVFDTDRKLPREEKEERQKKWQRLLQQTNQTQNYPLLDNPYKAIDYPAFDFDITSNYNNTNTSSHSSSSSAAKPSSITSFYTVRGTGDLGYLTQDFYASGSLSQQNLTNFRYSLGQVSPDADLLGPLQATQYSFGDVNSQPLSLATGSALGRGIFVTNREYSAPQNFDVHTFTGNSVPGYQVELYRNSELLSFQTVDASGRYNFPDVPILYGDNHFKLMFYGQQGQHEERDEVISAAATQLREGQFQYTFNLDQRGETFLPIGSQTSNATLPNGIEGVALARYGLTKDITYGVGLATTRLIDGSHQYLTTSGNTNFFGILTDTSYARDMKTQGWASGFGALTGIDDISLNGHYFRYHNFISESVNNNTLPLSSEADFSASSQFYIPLLENFGLSANAKREEFVDKTQIPRKTYGLRASKSIWGISLNDTVDYVVDSSKRFEDTFGVQTHIGGVELRATGVYDFKPEQKLGNSLLAADYRLTDKISAGTQFTKDLGGTGSSLISQNVNWDFEKFRLSLNGTGNLDTGGYSLGLDVIFSLGHDNDTDQWRMLPGSTTDGGIITGRVFVDESGSGEFEDGDKILDKVPVRINGVKTVLTPEGFFAAPIAPFEKTTVELQATEIEDPLLAPTYNGFEIVMRPGNSKRIDFPLQHATIIDGNVFVVDDSGKKNSAGDVVVELQDEAGKLLKRVISDFDGYFSFDKITKGDYWLNIPEEALKVVKATLKERKHIAIPTVTEFMTGQDIFLTSEVSQIVTAEMDPFGMPGSAADKQPSLEPSAPAISTPSAQSVPPTQAPAATTNTPSAPVSPAPVLQPPVTKTEPEQHVLIPPKEAANPTEQKVPEQKPAELPLSLLPSEPTKPAPEATASAPPVKETPAPVAPKTPETAPLSKPQDAEPLILSPVPLSDAPAKPEPHPVPSDNAPPMAPAAPVPEQEPELTPKPSQDGYM